MNGEFSHGLALGMTNRPRFFVGIESLRRREPAPGGGEGNELRDYCLIAAARLCR
jgi:hypothetical protein